MKHNSKLKRLSRSDNKIKNKGFKNFLQETKTELRKVSWPKRESVLLTSLIILGIVISLVIFVALVDMGLSRFFLILRIV